MNVKGEREERVSEEGCKKCVCFGGMHTFFLQFTSVVDDIDVSNSLLIFFHLLVNDPNRKLKVEEEKVACC